MYSNKKKLIFLFLKSVCKS